MIKNGFRQQLIDLVTAGDLFTEQEAIALLRSISSDTPEQMPDNAEKVIYWARRARVRSTILEVILRLGEHRAISVRPTADGDIDIELLS